MTLQETFLFDVDGVLCDRGQVIDPEFQKFLINFLKDKEYYIITGNNKEKAIKTIGQELVDKANISFFCLGNHICMDKQDIFINQLVLNDEELNFLNDKLLSSSFPTKLGNHIDVRKGSVNFSILGKPATYDQRQQYIDYDTINKERLNIIKEAKEKFPRLEFFIGGDISLDICMRGANKRQIWQFVGRWDNKVYFFSDRWDISKQEIDGPLWNRVGSNVNNKNYAIVDGYKQTWEILKTL